jgi:hypothetical protein
MTDQGAELRTKWAQALSCGTADRQWRAVALSITAPVTLLAAVRDQDNRISVLVETHLQHAPRHRVRFHAEGISIIDERWHEDNLLRLAVTLERPDLRDVYEILVLDLIAVAAASPSAELAIQHIVRRLETWQVCLRARRRGLQQAELVGLFGELTVLERLAVEIGLPQAIASWTGPLDGLHDFESAGRAIEVKSTIGVSHHIRVSRLDQMDAEGLDHLVLVRCRFHEAPEGVSLPELIGTLRSKINGTHPASMAEFSDKMMRTGYLDADAEFYAATRIVLTEIRAFEVREGFPRLTRACVPPAIVDAAYSLDERQLAAFTMESDELRALLCRMQDAYQTSGF